MRLWTEERTCLHVARMAFDGKYRGFCRGYEPLESEFFDGKLSLNRTGNNTGRVFHLDLLFPKSPIREIYALGWVVQPATCSGLLEKNTFLSVHIIELEYLAPIF